MEKEDIDILFEEAEKDAWCGECGLEHFLPALVRLAKKRGLSIPDWAKEMWCIDKGYKADDD